MYTSLWNSPEFYCCLVTAALVIFYATYRFQIRQMKKMMDIRQRIALDLHDDIGSTLSSIAIMSKMAASNPPVSTEKSGELFTTIGSASSRAMDLMSDIVWSVNPENDTMSNVISRMREYAAPILDAAQITWHLESVGTVDQQLLPMEKRKDFYLLFKEAINNLAKYSQATEAQVILSSENNGLRMFLKDNGSGFDTQRGYPGNGLKNMKARAERIHATFEISSAQDTGTSILLFIPLS